jgi:iron complex transport system ATP-binding protein
MTMLRWVDATSTRGGARILDAVTLEARPGEVLGIVGPNGAGKTTLLRCAAGLEPLSSGTILVGGTPLASLPARARARLVSFLPQQAEAAWPMRVADAVALGRLPHDAPRDAARDGEAIARALDAVGMAGAASRALPSLSGGERALVLLARALAVEAHVLLLDEPCAALDPGRQLAAMDLFRRVAAQGRVVCVVLHDLGLAARHCDRVALLHRGRLATLGVPDEALDDAALAQAYGIRAVRMRVEDQALLAPWERLGAGASREMRP